MKNLDDINQILQEKAAHEDDRMLISILGSEALAKACCDPFDYALKLRTGEIIEFTEATIISEGWIHIKVSESPILKRSLPFEVDRGMDIRVADIVWVMDAPNGS